MNGLLKTIIKPDWDDNPKRSEIIQAANLIQIGEFQLIQLAYKSWPFNESALALYDWAPIAEELKTLDRKIVLNSMILKWDNIKDEFAKLIKV